MTKKQNTLYAMIGLILGVSGGMVGTAFSMGADRQRVNGILANLVARDKEQKEEGQKELDRLTNQISNLQFSISKLTHTVGDLRTDVQVIKALMERMEYDLKNKN